MLRYRVRWNPPTPNRVCFNANNLRRAAMSTVQYPNAQAVFYQQYEVVRRDEVVGILLALFLGTFGVHHFYLRRTGLGILYCCFFWTGITTFLGFVECFFMPGRVREFNAIQAAGRAVALASECDRECTASDELCTCCAARGADCLQPLPNDESAGVEVLFSVRN